MSSKIPLDRGTLHAGRGVSFAVAEGECVCIVGLSGCGQSLTALAIMGLSVRSARLIDADPSELSGGQGQRAAIARPQILNPSHVEQPSTPALPNVNN